MYPHFLPVILLLWKHDCIHWLPHVHMLHLRFEMERVLERIEEGVAKNVLLIKIQGPLCGHMESYVDTNFSITKSRSEQACASDLFGLAL